MHLSRPADFSRLAKNGRQRSGLTQQQLADRAGVTRQLVARLENGTGDPSLSSALRVLNALDITLSTSPSSAGEAQALAVAPVPDAASELQQAIRQHLATSTIALAPRALTQAEVGPAFDAYLAELQRHAEQNSDDA